jgi:hypothetical protein
MNKTQVLTELRRTIIEEMCVKKWRDVWFFPERDGVKGWSGAAPIMFVGLNPSMGTFPPKADDFLLYRSLSHAGLYDAHITDLLKIRLNGKLVKESFANSDLVRLHKAWMMEEVELLDPILIVALGHKTFTYLEAWLPNEMHSSIKEIHHYSWADRYGKSAVFEHDVAMIRDMYLKQSPNQGVQQDGPPARR